MGERRNEEKIRKASRNKLNTRVLKKVKRRLWKEEQMKETTNLEESNYDLASSDKGTEKWLHMTPGDLIFIQLQWKRNLSLCWKSVK